MQGGRGRREGPLTLTLVSAKYSARSGGSSHDPEQDESMEGLFGPDRPRAQTRKSYGYAFSPDVRSQCVLAA